MERQDSCWQQTCSTAANNIANTCGKGTFDCDWFPPTTDWYSNFTNTSNAFCNSVSPTGFSYGIYQNAIGQTISSNTGLLFSQTYFYCLWVGLLALRYIFVPTWHSCEVDDPVASNQHVVKNVLIIRFQCVSLFFLGD